MEKNGELVNFTLILLSINITNFLQNKQWSSNIEQGKISSMFVVLVVINFIFLQPLARMSWLVRCFPMCLSRLSHLSMMCMAWHVMTSHTMHLTNTKMPSPFLNSTQANWVAQLSWHFLTTLSFLCHFLVGGSTQLTFVELKHKLISSSSERTPPTYIVATPLWAKCEGEAHTPKSGKLESSGTPKNSKFDCRGQISLHLNVLGVIGKVLKCRCPKWPRIGHLDICSPSYGQKKGQKSNCPTTKSRESTSSRHPNLKCDTALESSERGLQVWLRPRPDRRLGREVMMPQNLGSPKPGQF
jgi:hypothetical protein